MWVAGMLALIDGQLRLARGDRAGDVRATFAAGLHPPLTADGDSEERGSVMRERLLAEMQQVAAAVSTDTVGAEAALEGDERVEEEEMSASRCRPAARSPLAPHPP